MTTIPKGWKLVPEEPDDGMIEAGNEAIEQGAEWGRMVSPADVYHAMLAVSPSPPTPESGEPLVFIYRNFRGEVSTRRVQPLGIRFGTTEWHPEPQWLLRAFDLDKQAEREFAIRSLRGAEPGDGWRPIETAPKDGTPVILGNFNNLFWPLRVRCWSGTAEHGHWRGHDADEATHWRPLPPPPQAKGG